MMLTIRTAEQIAAENAERAAEAERAAARAYLAETDWYAVRLAETGKPVPPAIGEARAAARRVLSET